MISRTTSFLLPVAVPAPPRLHIGSDKPMGGFRIVAKAGAVIPSLAVWHACSEESSLHVGHIAEWGMAASPSQWSWMSVSSESFELNSWLARGLVGAPAFMQLQSPGLFFSPATEFSRVEVGERGRRGQAAVVLTYWVPELCVSSTWSCTDMLVSSESPLHIHYTAKVGGGQGGMQLHYHPTLDPPLDMPSPMNWSTKIL